MPVSLPQPSAFPYQDHESFEVSAFRSELEQLAKQLGGDAKLTDRALAEHLDAHDPLSAMRGNYHIPTLADVCDLASGSHESGAGASATTASDSALYMCGNSLGPLPKLSEQYVQEELDAWKRKAVLGHFSHPYDRPWTSMDLGISEMCADLVGAKPSEVTVMGTLTGNLHSLLSTFYRPAAKPFGVDFKGDVEQARRDGAKVKHKIVYEDKAFPSDRYALGSVIELNGFDVATSLVPLKPKHGSKTLVEQDILDTIEQLGREGETALILLGGVQYFTGQFFPLEKISKLAHRHGILFGVDLAHAFCNVPLKLHDWNVDFAAWCTYKYGNSGPGGMAGLFVHERWTDVSDDRQLTRPAGWYGHERQTRFSMPEQFKPVAGAGGWQVSNGSVLDMASLRGSLETIFKVKQLVPPPPSTAGKDEVGYGSVMPILRARSLRLTSYLELLLTRPGFLPSSVDVRLVTPSNPAQRGSQLCIQFPEPSNAAPKATPHPHDPQQHHPSPNPTGTGDLKNNDVPPPIDGKKLVARAEQRYGLVADIRHPDMLRLAPLAQYSSFVDVFRTAEALRVSILDEIEAE